VTVGVGGAGSIANFVIDNRCLAAQGVGGGDYPVGGIIAKGGGAAFGVGGASSIVNFSNSLILPLEAFRTNGIDLDPLFRLLVVLHLG
jgi:hypothetical protein